MFLFVLPCIGASRNICYSQLEYGVPYLSLTDFFQVQHVVFLKEYMLFTIGRWSSLLVCNRLVPSIACALSKDGEPHATDKRCVCCCSILFHLLNSVSSGKSLQFMRKMGLSSIRFVDARLWYVNFPLVDLDLWSQR